MDKISQFLRQIRANAINYHLLLAISIFVLVWFYNNEIALRVGDFIDSQGESTLLKPVIFIAIFLLIWLWQSDSGLLIAHNLAKSRI